jgi:hypothetical protein
MGTRRNHVGVARITESGHLLLQEYIQVKKLLRANIFFDWNQIVEDLNGRFNDFFLPKGIMARNLLKVTRNGEELPQYGINIYKFNYVFIEDDELEEMIAEGYLIDDTDNYTI